MEAEKIRIIDDDFRSFQTGYLPTDISAVGEYHYAPPQGHTGIWYEPNKDTSWIGKKCWLIREHEGSHEMEIAIDNGDCTTIPMLIAGDSDWRNYILCCRIWPLTRRRFYGISLRYMDSRHFYLFVLENGNKASLYKKHEESLTVLAQAEYPYDADHWYTLQAAAHDGFITCGINGTEMFRVADDSYPSGKVGMAGMAPARYASVTLDLDREDYLRSLREQRRRKARELQKQMLYPSPRLWKILDLKDFGSARNIRYGDLTGDGRIDFLFLQNMSNLSLGDESMISCMTAVDLDGRVLWQIGEPDARNGMLTADLPVQIYDIDGDGNNEVIYCKDFKLIVADGKTGATKHWTRTPECVPVENYKIYANVYYDRIVGDSIRICNFSGGQRPSDILLKDRYNNIWAYDCKLNIKWHRSVNCGHFPVSFDINGDGRDELMAGHTLLDCNGNVIWELPGMVCHVDEIVIGKFDPDNEKNLIAMASGEDGFLLADETGRLFVQDHVGHAQRLSVAKYMPEMPGLQICVTTFWRNTGIIAWYDCKGKRLHSFEPGANGNVIAPVNWTGDGRELLLYSASERFGGLFDGGGDRVAAFPQDGHPELCCDAIDLHGDDREELLAWDAGRMYIYTQDDCPKTTSYAPLKYDNYNYSNYRGEYSFPAWKVGH